MFAQWILLILYVGIGVANIVRGVLGVFISPVVSSVAGLLVVLGVAYIVWGLVFLAIAAVYLASDERFSPVVLVGSAVLYQVTLWSTKLLGDRSSYARRLWPRDLVLTGLYVGFVILLTWVTAVWRSRQRDHLPK